jgi:hypothetical protein
MVRLATRPVPALLWRGQDHHRARVGRSLFVAIHSRLTAAGCEMARLMS